MEISRSFWWSTPNKKKVLICKKVLVWMESEDCFHSKFEFYGPYKHPPPPSPPLPLWKSGAVIGQLLTTSDS